MSEDLKAYRLQLIADAVEKVNEERALAERIGEEFSLDEVELWPEQL